MRMYQQRGYTRESRVEEGHCLRAVFNPGNVKLNLRAAWLHFALFCFILVMIARKEPPFVLKFKKMWAPGGNLPPPNSPLSSSVCNGKNYTDPNNDGRTDDSSVFDWFECVREVYQEEQKKLCEACQPSPAQETLFVERSGQGAAAAYNLSTNTLSCGTQYTFSRPAHEQGGDPWNIKTNGSYVLAQSLVPGGDVEHTFDCNTCFGQTWVAESTSNPSMHDDLTITGCHADPPSDCSIYTDCDEPFQIRDARYSTKDTDALTNAAVLSDGDFGDIKVAYLLLLFEFITLAVHFALGQEGCDGKDSFYEELLKQQLQPFRWLEYSVTASIMLWCALSLSRVQEQFLLISLFVNSFYLNFVGGAMFEVCAWIVRNTKEPHARVRCTVSTRVLSDGLSLSARCARIDGLAIKVKTLFRWLQWICFFSAWLSYATVLWTSFDAMYSIIEPYTSNPNTGVLWAELFDVVAWVNTGIFVTYSCFPLIHLYVFWPWRHPDEAKSTARYAYGETLYIYASFIAKTTLVATIGYAAFMRED